MNPLTLPQRAKNNLEPSEQLNTAQSKPWPSAFIQSPDRQASSLRLCGCVSLFLPQHDLFLLFGVFLFISFMSSPLQIGGPAERPCSAVQLGGSLGGQAKVRRQPVQHIPVRVSASLSLSRFSPRSKQALLPTLPRASSSGWRRCLVGGRGSVQLEEVLLIPALHPCCLPTLTSDLPAAPDHAQALVGDPPQTCLVLFSPFIPLHSSSARVLGTLGHLVALRRQGQQGRDACTVVYLYMLAPLSTQ